MFKFLKKDNSQDWKIVVYFGEQKEINILFRLFIGVIFLWLFIIVISTLPWIVLVLIYALFKLRNTFNNLSSSRSIERQLRYFIKANKLYEIEVIDRKELFGNGVEHEKVITNSVRLGYLETDEFLKIRAYKRADIFNDKMNSLESGLASLFGLSLYNKIDSIHYCEYEFRKQRDRRIIVSSGQGKSLNPTTKIPLNSNLEWNVLKQPHLLLAGVTGGGKTTFLNYLIIEMKRMMGEVYICDPKRSDLASIQHVWGKSFVASDVNNIARLTREVREKMMERFVTYKENPENFVYGASYVDYNLSPIFLIFDELGAFRASADKKVFTETISNLTEIILKGREMGVFVCLSTQQPNAQNIPTELRDNLSVRVALGNMSNEAYRMVFGELDGLETIRGQGTGYIFLDGLGWSNPKYYETPYLDYKKFNFISELRYYN